MTILFYKLSFEVKLFLFNLTHSSRGHFIPNRNTVTAILITVQATIVSHYISSGEDKLIEKLLLLHNSIITLNCVCQNLKCLNDKCGKYTVILFHRNPTLCKVPAYCQQLWLPLACARKPLQSWIIFFWSKKIHLTC